MYLRYLRRSYSKSHEMAPNLTLAPVAPPVHSRDSHIPGREPAAVSRPPQELHNGDTQSAAKPVPSSTTSRPDDTDTDGEIDVDDCEDRECQPVHWSLQCSNI